MPASVRALPLVKKIAETDDFATSNVVILGRGIFGWAPPDGGAPFRHLAMSSPRDVLLRLFVTDSALEALKG